MIPAQLECRVLSGLHQGARATLSPDAARYTVGRDTSADLVLRDLPVANGQIVLKEDSWQWIDTDFETTLTIGETLDLGGLVIQVCVSDTPWLESPDTPATLVRQSSAPIAPSPTNTTANDPTATETSDTPPASDAKENSLQTRYPLINNRAGTSRRRMGQAAAGVGIALVVSLSGVIFWNLLGSETNEEITAQSQAAAAASAQLAENLETDFKAIETLLNERDIVDRVEATLNPSSGRIEILGVMADDQEYEDFVRAVRKITSRVALRITTHRDFSTDAIGLQQDLPEGIQITTKPIGILTVKGTVSDDEERENLISRIENLVPMAAEIEVQLKTKAEVMKENRERRQTGRDADAFLPRIMSVVGGPEPFIVLPNGDRIMVGGQINGLTLSAITATHIEYQTGEGKTVRAPR